MLCSTFFETHENAQSHRSANLNHGRKLSWIRGYSCNETRWKKLQTFQDMVLTSRRTCSIMPVFFGLMPKDETDLFVVPTESVGHGESRVSSSLFSHVYEYVWVEPMRPNVIFDVVTCGVCLGFQLLLMRWASSTRDRPSGRKNRFIGEKSRWFISQRGCVKYDGKSEKENQSPGKNAQGMTVVRLIHSNCYENAREECIWCGFVSICPERFQPIGIKAIGSVRLPLARWQMKANVAYDKSDDNKKSIAHWNMLREFVWHRQES